LTQSRELMSFNSSSLLFPLLKPSRPKDSAFIPQLSLNLQDKLNAERVKTGVLSERTSSI
jgi:hypothetical protein